MLILVNFHCLFLLIFLKAVFSEPVLISMSRVIHNSAVFSRAPSCHFEFWFIVMGDAVMSNFNVENRDGNSC